MPRLIIVSAVLAAVSLGVPTIASAEESAKNASGQSAREKAEKAEKAKAEKAEKQQEDANKKDAEAKRKKADQADKEAREAEAKAGKDDPSVAGQVERAVDDADDSADKTNASVVGEDAQDENQREALDPKLRKKNNKEGDKIAEDIGIATTNAARYVTDGVSDATSASDKPGPYRPFALSWNPLGLIVGGRVSIGAEWAPITHHAVIVSPHFARTSADVVSGANDSFKQTFTGFGGELGYRYYTGHRGMNGVFVGPSLIAGVYNAALPGRDQPFTNFGVAMDVGVQHIIADHFLIGGGVGIEYLRVSHDFGDLPDGPSTIASQGVKPRLLFQGGYAF